MADYKSMYHKLFNLQMDTIIELEALVDKLKTSQLETKAIYLAGENIVALAEIEESEK